MGAKKKRQESDWQEHDRLPVCRPVDANDDESDVCPDQQYSNHDLKCSSCCNNSNTCSNVRVNDELTRQNSVYSNHSFSINLCSSRKSFCHLLRSNVLVVPLIFLIASYNIVQVESVCVWQGGGGFKVACGFRQSGLFRLRSIGGIKGYVGAGFTIGDEDGFKDSLTNTEGHHHQPQHAGGYLPTHVHTQRSLPAGQNGQIGQFSHIQEHPMPPLSGDPNTQSQQQFQYLQTIQDQLAVDHQNLELKAADQRSQKMLEQQLYAQGMPMPPSPTPTAKVKRAGGLTKRASLWNWPNIFGRGKNKENGHGKSKKQKNHDFHGPPQRHHGPPPNRRGGPPPHKNKPGPAPRFDRPGKNGPPRKERFPDKQGRRGPSGGPNKFPPRPNNKENFVEYMKNPFSHLQENFIGKNSQENRRMHNIEQEQNHNFNKNFASGQPPHFPQQNNNPQQNQFQHQQPPQFGGNSQQMPPLLMMPPAGPPSEGQNFPQFKKIPNNLNQNHGNDYEDAPEFHQQDQHQHLPQQNSQIDRMMQEHEQGNEPTDYNYNNSPEAQFPSEREDSADPAGLKMLKRTENFGTIFHLMNPDGAPVNMQFEKQPVLPPSLQFSSQQQQDLAEELLMPNPDFDASGVGLGSMNMNDNGGGGGGGGELENPLATAVYDPNVFPDIYFTTTEKHHQQQELMNHNMLGGAPYPLSQEMLENPLLQQNAIKRILGSSENKPRSSEQQQQQHLQRRLKHRKKVRPHLRSNEQVSSDAISTEVPTVVPRRKMRRRKKFRAQQHANNNQVDTSEPELTGSDNVALPKRRRKGKRKKYKLQTAEPTLPSSTERMGLAADGGEQASVELKTESPAPELLTTTPSPQPEYESLLPTVSSSENKIKSAETSGKTKTKTSFSLPSKEDVQSPSLEVVASPSSETKMETTTMTRTSTEETTTQVPFSFSPFGYQDALRGKQKLDDYDSFSGPGEFFYDPRYPPDHEVNRGTQKNMTKFIRPRGPYQESSTTSTSTTTQSPFILYDMMGTRNQSRFSSRFDKGTSPFRLDTDDTSSAGAAAADDTARVGTPYGHGHNQHPFYANNKMHPETNDKGVFLKFDSNEWANNEQKSHYHKKPDPFSHHYNRTSFNSGYYGGSKEFRPSAELPSSLMGWERHLQTTTTPPTPSPVYPRFSSENKSKFAQKSSSVEHGLFGPTMETFGPPRTTTTPFSPESGERGNKQRKLHKNLFGGSSADVSDAGNWASPNFWGTLQDSDRYGASSDFERNNNLKRLMEFGDPNGLKEVHPGDLSSPTPLPMPSPSPPQQHTAEDLDSDYYLSPSTPGTRWGKQRRRKGRPTAAPTTPSSAPFISTIRPFPTSTTTAVPPKWLAVMSNEVDGPAEYYDNLDPNMSLPPSSSSLETNLKINAKGKNEKSGIEIKFKSGEERDPEEEADNKNQEVQQQQPNSTKPAPAPQQNFNLLGFPTNTNSGFPGVMVHDFDASHGYGFGEGMKDEPPQPPPPSSEIGYYPNVNNDNRREHSVVPSGPTGPPSSVLFPPVNNPFGANKNDKNQRPVYPGRNPDQGNRNDYDPSSEDDMAQQNSGLPSHNDNPFKAFEKQTQVNSGMGFVSTKHEFKEMNDQIQKFSTIPESFLRRDSSEKLEGQPPNMNGEHEYAPPGEAPSNGMDEIPGFLNIALPEMNPSPADPTFNEGQQIHHPAQFAPSGFSHDFRDHDMPTGSEQFPPSMPPGMGNENGPPPPPNGMKDNVRLNGDNPQDIHWDFRPLEDNNVEPIPQYHRPVPVETTTRHPMIHLDLVKSNQPISPPGRPPMGPEGNFRGPPMIREERPPNVRDEPFRPPPGPLRQPPPFHEEHNNLPPRNDRGPPPPPMRNDNHGRPPPLPPRRDEPHGRPPPPMRDEPQRRPPPLIRDDPRGRPPPPPHREHERPPPPHREHERPPPPHREQERPPPPHRPPPPPQREHERPPPPPHREHERPPPPHRPPPPPQREHERPSPPQREHERPPPPHRPPPPPQREHERPPPPHRPPPPPQREHERPPPPQREHERPPPPPGRRGPPPQNHHNPEHDRPNFPPQSGDGPPRRIPDDRFREGPQQHPPPSRQHDNRPKPGAFFYPPSKEDSFIFDKDRRNFLDQHKTIENLRPPSKNEGHPGQQRGDHWQEEQNRNPGLPRIPPTPQGMPKFLDIQKVPKDQQPKSNAQNPFLQKPPHVKPTNIPPQVFKPPPPPPPKQNFFANLLTGPFGKTNSNPPPPPKNRPQQLPPPPHRPPPNHNQPQRQPHPPQKDPDPFARIPFHNNRQQDKPNNPNNFINAYNDRFEPPAPHGHENNVNPILPAFPFPGKESRLPFLPFPPGDSVESFVDLDKDPHAHLLPPTLVPLPHVEGEHPPALPVRTLKNEPQNQQAPSRPVYQPKPNNNEPRDEKHKLLEAFETLNKANYDTIQSLAADKYGPGFIDKLKTKSNMINPEQPQQKHVLPIRFEPLPIMTTTTTTPSPKPLYNMFAAFNTKKPTPAIQDETNKLAELLKMINKPQSQAPSAQQLQSASSMPSNNNNNDALTNLLQSLQKATPPPTTITTTRRPEMPSNPGLVSLTSTFNTASNDIKSLQAQLAKAIIAKAHRKNQPDELEKPHYQPLTINVNANPSENPLTVLQQLAQSRQDTVHAANAATKNYTASQIETLKKLIALNNIEQKLSNNNDQLSKLQALLPAALKAPSPSFPPSNSITSKMLDSSTANSNQLHGTDPTILALKALAMSKSHNVNPQPSISFPQQVKPTDPSSGPIDVDLSAILSPSPPVVEQMNRKRRLTNVKNAPKSFFPANATQGFEDFSAPLWSEFHCDEQSFFPGLYADTELGCRVFHLCAKTDAGYMMKSFRCPKETVFDQEVLRCNWNLFVDCPASTKKYHFNKYLSQSFQFLKILGEFSANYQKTNDKQ